MLKSLDYSEPARFDFCTDAYVYECLFQPKRSSTLFVLFHGAKDQNEQSPPFFDRGTWSDIFPGSLLNVSDPTIGASKALRLGWYMGGKSEWALERIAYIVRVVAEQISAKRIVAYGSSNGGFAALAMRLHLPEVSTIAINAQTNAAKFYSRLDDVAQFVFEYGQEEVDAIGQYRNRYDLVYQSQKMISGSPLLLVQNTRDFYHVVNHLCPFLKSIKFPHFKSMDFSLDYGEEGEVFQSGSTKVLLYTSDGGHVPETKAMAARILRLEGLGS